MTDTILALDIGLTNGKAVLFAADGRLIARASHPYRTLYPQPDWAEQDPEDWWRAVNAGLRDLRRIAPLELERVAAISITGHMHALVCLGEEGSSLGPALVLGDQRSVAEAEAISARVGLERIYRMTGARMDASMPLAKLCWLQRHLPEVHRDARAFIACKDWLRHRLTGDRLTDPVDACGTSLYDISTGAWSPELVDVAGIRSEQLPRVCDPCALAGKLLPAAARALGLKAGIPVVVGAGDDVEVLGNNLMQPGLSLEHLGTTGSILTCADRPVYDPEMAIELYPHTAPGLWVLGGSITSAGLARGWAEQTLAPAAKAGGLSALVQPPNLERPLVFVPHLTGERCPAWDPRARGVWLGLTPAHTAADLQRAVLEGVAFALKGVLQRIESLVGRQAHLTVGGGVSLGDPWLATRAAVYDRPLRLLDAPEPTALGAMIVAAVGVGLYPTLAEAAARVTADGAEIEPDPALARAYRELYELYLAASEASRQALRRWQAAHDARMP